MLTVTRRVEIQSVLAVIALALAVCSCLPARPDDPQDPQCLEFASSGPPEDSPYVLPYRVGTTHRVFQTYCGPVSHGKDGQMAIDFSMPAGTEILAARGGVVRAVVDGYEDFGRHFNYIYIEHDDGTAAFYAHLQRGSARVRIGERVSARQPIAKSGASGTSLEHLHFGVARTWPVRNADGMPVNFSNAQGSLDERDGLKQGVAYLALP